MIFWKLLNRPTPFPRDVYKRQPRSWPRISKRRKNGRISWKRLKKPCRKSASSPRKPFMTRPRACLLYTSFFTLLLLLYRTSAKSQGMKQLMAGGGVVLIGKMCIRDSREIGRRYGRAGNTTGRRIQMILRQLRAKLEGLSYEPATSL